MSKSHAEELLAVHLSEDGIPFEREYKAIPNRKYRYDFFIPPDLLIEVQGGIYMRGRSKHSSGFGITRDCEKVSLATLHGYRILQFPTKKVLDGKAIAFIRKVLQAE